MHYATTINGDEASRLAFGLEEHTLTQEQADHVLPIMASYGNILQGVRNEIAEIERKQPDPDAVHS